MKTFVRSPLIIIVLGALSIFSLRAQTVTVLDGFQETALGMPPGTTTNGYTAARCNFVGSRGFCNTNIALFTAYGGRSSQGLVSIAQYTATNANDPNVTEGTNSMGITFSAQGFGNDFQIVLSDTNSFLVEQAAAAGQAGRYILRYDVIFANPSQYTHFNQHVYIGNAQDYLQISAALTNGFETYSCALEFPALAIPAANSGTNIQMVIADDFGTTQSPFTNCTIYIDNVRLVDTYASPSTIPIVYPLISFSTGISAVSNLYPTVTSYYGNPTTPRAYLSRYVTNGLYNPATNGVPNQCTQSNQLAFRHWIPSPYDTDFAVTEGDGCALQVSNYCTGSSYNGYQADFAISFAGTKLAQIVSSNFPPAQLAHYALRWDTTMPEVWAVADAFYVNFTFTTGAAALPMCQGRRENFVQTGLQRLSYSVTLDQIAAWGGSPVGGNPAIIFLSDAEDMAGPLFYFFDNFELIDTTPAVTVPSPTITAYAYNPVTRQFTLTWTSVPGAQYAVMASASVSSGYGAILSGIPSGGSTTTATVTMPNTDAGYLRVLVQ
jgi:hypothetical protein